MTTKPNDLKNSTAPIAQTDPKGVRIDGYFGPGLLRPGVGKLVQRSGEPQFCGSLAFRVNSCDVGESKYLDEKTGKPRVSKRFNGEFLGITFEDKRIYAAEGYIPKAIERSTQIRVERGEDVAFAGDLWCEPADSNIGFGYRLYDRRPRPADDPLLELAVMAGLIDPPTPALPARPSSSEGEVDPETGEVIEAPSVADAAQ